MPSVLTQHVKQTEIMCDSRDNAASWYTPVRPLNPSGAPCRGVHSSVKPLESVNWYRSVSAGPRLCPRLLKTLLFIRFHRSHPKEESQLRNRWETDIDHSRCRLLSLSTFAKLFVRACSLRVWADFNAVAVGTELQLLFFSFFLWCTCCRISVHLCCSLTVTVTLHLQPWKHKIKAKTSRSEY